MNLLFSLKKKKLNYPFLALVGSCLYLSSCATQHPQFGKDIKVKEPMNLEGKKVQSIYLLGNAGYLDRPDNKKNLEILNHQLSKADSLSYLFFLGDNVYKTGIVVDSAQQNFQKSRQKLQIEIDLAKNFKGKTLFIPGNIDWKNGIKGILEQERIVNKALPNASFLPKSSCSIGKINVNDNVAIISIDSEWYLQNWDKQPNINENCYIKSREDFFEELENQLNNFQNKTTIIAMHHPLYSNGIHGGYFDIKKQLYPFGDDIKVPMPIVGSFLNLLRSTTGLSTQDVNNYKYRELASQISTIIENRNNVIVVSAHDNSLQYIQNNNVKQIISGAVSKRESAKAVRDNDFSYGDKGYAVLDLYDNGESKVNFYAFTENGVELLLSKQVTDKKNIALAKDYSDKVFSKQVNTSVYPKEITEKPKSYEFLFGKHYRDIYGKSIAVNTLNLNDYHGGLFPIRMTGGSQTKNLLLQDLHGEEYTMRSIKKSATQFIQQFAFKDKYIANEFEGSFSERFLMDFYTTNHPYYPLAVSGMMNSIQILHAKPNLYYVPKQTNLQDYNENFGDEMYMVEDHKIQNFKDSVLGLPQKIVSSDEMLSLITKGNKTSVDKNAYVRARLFDMLVGDWDRTENKWDWAAYRDGDKMIYKPISKETDQVFPRYDGLFFKIVLSSSPALKHMQDFKDDIKNVKWLNRKPYPLDLAILEASDLNLWKKEAKIIQNNLTENEIRKSFDLLPKEIKQEYDDVIIQNLMDRKSNLEKYAEEYNKVLRRLVILKGTDQDDVFIITRLPEGITNIKIYSSANQKLIFDQDFDKKETKEIRLYGLNGKDYFKVDGNPSQSILIRLIGGLDDDTYEVKRSSRIRIYDYANGSNISQSRFLTFRKFEDDYDINTYSFKQPEYNFLTTAPTVGYNPDDGLKLGFSPTYTVNGFDRNPYSQKHNLQLNYYFATGGFEAKYKGTFVKAIGKWNLDLNATYTSPAFSANFFGLGNTTANYQRRLGMDYNRIRLHSYSFGPSLIKSTNNIGSLDISALYSYKQIEENLNRIVGEPDQNINRDVFKGQNFGELGIKYIFKNYDNESLPKLGMTFFANGKYITNLSDFHRHFFFTEVNLGFTHKVSANGRLTIASMLKGKAVWGQNENIEFYQMASMGGDSDFRGYRPGRFSANKVFLQSSDLRFDAFGFKAIVPLRLGVFIGADYGRVWLDGENSNKWHTSTGGGIWLNGVQSVTASISYFKGEDPGRVVVGFNFGF